MLEENSFKFADKHFVQTHGIAMRNKISVAFSVISMVYLEERLLTFVWKRFTDDIFSLWVTHEQKFERFTFINQRS